MLNFISFMGLLILIGICYLLSENKKSINWKLVITGILIQVGLGLFILKTPLGMNFFSTAKDIANATIGFTSAGSEFVFGDLARPQKMGMIFATMVLPTIIFIGALTSVLYHIGLMQKIVKLFAVVMMKIMGTSGAESLASAANIFVGMTEAPLVIRPYLKTMTKSEIMSLMSGGFATVAGGIMAAYVLMGIDAGHLLAASIMSAPAALVCAKIIIPEVGKPETAGTVNVNFEKTTVNIIDAAASGATDGLKLCLNVAAMVLAFVALMALINGILGYVGVKFGFPELSLELILGYLFSPFAFILGVPFSECLEVGSLLAKKIVVNEYVAYADLQGKLGTLSKRSIVLSTYALCGFSNFSSIAIQIGGIGAIEPSRKKDLANLGLRALIAGTFACMMTACVVGIFY